MTQEGKKGIFVGINIPSDEILNNCIHCGLCLPTCPTYSLTCLEKSSPRGRIRLIKAVAEGSLKITNEFIYEMNFCLGCRACETACPAGIKYGSLVEAAKAYIYQQKCIHSVKYLINSRLVNWIFAEHSRLKKIAKVFRFIQNSAFIQIFLNSKLFSLTTKSFLDIQKLTPMISQVFSTDTLVERNQIKKNPRYRVVFLTGCIMDVAFADVNNDTVQLLLYHDCEVIVPSGQKCCGAIQTHNGDLSGAKESARHNIELFLHYNFDYIITNSAGCGAFIKSYDKILASDSLYAEKAKMISKGAKDITEFLNKTGFNPQEQNSNALFHNKRITYHDACHLVHAQGISEQPRKLIRSIKGIEYIELPESSWCCGSAGTYNITHYKDSMKILDRKIKNIKQVRPDIIVTGNPGCLIQLQHGLQKEGMQVELLHTATFLRQACEI
jgi:glycolate oxidase iron-sulfur subunit